MKLSQLGFFCAVVERGTIAAAAEQLHCVPSNITTRLRELEGQLGVALFNRERNRLLVTPEGRLLYRHATRLLALADAAASRHARLARYPARRYPWRFRRTGTAVMGNYFESPFRGKLLSEQVSNPNIRVGRYSYYSGYYHGHSFDDCARYLMPDRDDVDKLVIGSFCSIGSGAAFIMAGNQGHRAEWASTFPFHFMHEEPAFAGAVNGYQPAGDTLIGHDVWIGTEAMFMPGVRVGHGAIIGSRALVTGDVEPYAIVGGNPARTIRKRFSDGDIQNLLEMAWWDWPLADIEAAMPLLCAGDIPALYRHWKQRQATA